MSEEHEDEGPSEPMAPLWMITYADMITLLFAFFVVLFSMMEIKQPKVDMTMRQFQKQFGVLPDKPTQPQPFINPQTLSLVQSAVLRRGPRGKHDAVRTIIEDKMTKRTIGGSELFRPDSAELTPTGRQLLQNEIAPALQGYTNRIDIRGHTASSNYEDGWVLGFQRAYAVLDFLTNTCGLDSRRFRATSCADNEPLATNQTPQGREQNRRVDIIMTEEPISELDIRER